MCIVFVICSGQKNGGQIDDVRCVMEWSEEQ
jgi:hypothetical protein